MVAEADTVLKWRQVLFEVLDMDQLMLLTQVLGQSQTSLMLNRGTVINGPQPWTKLPHIMCVSFLKPELVVRTHNPKCNTELFKTIHSGLYLAGTPVTTSLQLLLIVKLLLHLRILFISQRHVEHTVEREAFPMEFLPLKNGKHSIVIFSQHEHHMFFFLFVLF